MGGTERGPGDLTAPRAAGCPQTPRGEMLQCARGGQVEQPPPAHSSRVENQGLSELTHHFCRGEAAGHLSRGTFRQGRENRLPARRHPPSSPPRPGFSLRTEPVRTPRRKKTHRRAENCKLMTAPAPGVATLRRGDPAAQGSTGPAPAEPARQDSCQAVPTGSCLWKRARRRAGGQGQPAARASPTTHSAGRRPPPRGNNRPFHQCRGGSGCGGGCHLRGQSQGPQGAPPRTPPQCRAALQKQG